MDTETGELQERRRRQDLLELLDRLSPGIAELTKAIEQEVEKCPAAKRLIVSKP